MGKHDEYQKGYDVGFQAGYVQGRMAVASDRDNDRAQAQAQPQPTTNGWIKVTPDLRDQFELSVFVDEAYVICDMSGEIVAVLDTRS